MKLFFKTTFFNIFLLATIFGNNNITLAADQTPPSATTAATTKPQVQPTKYKYDGGFFYGRVGTGMYIPPKNIFGGDATRINIADENLVKQPDVSNIPDLQHETTFVPLLNIAFGYNFYSKSFWHFGAEISVDLNFGRRAAIGNVLYIHETELSTGLSSILTELKFRTGIKIHTEHIRIVPYLTFGFAVNIMNGKEYNFDLTKLPTDPNYFSVDKNALHALFGVTYGAGLMINSRKYPVGFFIEFSIPTFFNPQRGLLAFSTKPVHLIVPVDTDININTTTNIDTPITTTVTTNTHVNTPITTTVTTTTTLNSPNVVISPVIPSPGAGAIPGAVVDALIPALSARLQGAVAGAGAGTGTGTGTGTLSGNFAGTGTGVGHITGAFHGTGTAHAVGQAIIDIPGNDSIGGTTWANLTIIFEPKIVAGIQVGF